MRRASSLIITFLICLALVGSALADSITMNGTVVNAAPQTVTAELGGTISQVYVTAGDRVQTGDTIAVLETEKIYALQDGTVRLFGEIGDSAEMVAERYGAVAYIEPACEYTISASTKNAYDLEENKIIHPGETVYIRCVDDSKNTGIGLVTAVSGTSFSVEVTEGSFENGESVYLYRTETYMAVSRIGKGSISRQDPVAYTAEGIIVGYPVENDMTVSKGAVLFETLAGSYANQTDGLNRISAAETGIVAALSLSIGSTVASGDAVMTFYADDAMRIQATVTETDLQYFKVGDTVRVEFTYINGGDFSMTGTIEKISGVGSALNEDSDEASFTVWIIPESTEALSYGMNAVISRMASDGN